MPKQEKDIQKEILNWLETRGVFAWKNFTTGIPDANVDGGYRTNPNSGHSDIFGILPDGRFLAIEVKKPGHKTSKERLKKQQIFICRVQINGGIGMFAISLDEVKSHLVDTLNNIEPYEFKRATQWASNLISRMVENGY